MTSILLLVLAAALLVFSCLNIISAQFILLWMGSILSKEFGHWFALLSLGLLIFAGRHYLKRRSQFQKSFDLKSLLAILFLILATVNFLRPLASAIKHAPAWREALGPGTPRLLHFKTLWLGRGEDKVNYQTLKYFESDKQLITLDYYPAQGTSNQAWIVIVHGGGWNAGDSQQLPELNSHLALEGYAVFSINYRLAPEFRWSDVKQDMNKAVAFIQSRATEFKIDPANYAVLGRSAGGQIAGVYGYSKMATPAKAVILFYSPTDLTFGFEAGDEDDILASRSLVRDYMGNDPYHDKVAYADSSVIDHLTDHPVPTLLLHGREDTLVWNKHSQRLLYRLQVLKVPAVYIEMPWATHGFDFSLNGPAGQISTTAVDQFLKTWLLK